MQESNYLPWVQSLEPVPDPEQAFLKLVGEPHCLFLDSALRNRSLGRYSFIAADPYEFLKFPIGASGVLESLRARLPAEPVASVPGLPPFQGGLAGLFSYDFGRSLEAVPPPRFDEFAVPAAAIGCYDTVIAFDHVVSKAWVISQGLPETDPAARRRRAEARGRALLQRLQEPIGQRRRIQESAPIAPSDLAPQFPVASFAGLTSNFGAEQYLRAARAAIEYIYAGDIFQVNLAQRLLYPDQGDAVALYLRLRQRNPAPFAGYFDLGNFRILSASPERFVSVRDREVEARPIKGTRQRSRSPEADLFAGDELRESEKDRAENVMIVDLLRNDMSRICRPESVRVTQLCQLEVFQYVQHLVSAIRGTLRPDATALDVLPAAFPGGSITGAPKVRAMEIIAELEPTARGPYCGSLGYISADGSLDLSILIRTITAGRGWLQLPAGGGIVAQSIPEREYEETWHKATGLLRALRT